MRSGKLLCLAFLFCFVLYGNSQNYHWQLKETIILVDGKATKVILNSEGKVIQTLDRVRNISYQSKKSPDKIIEANLDYTQSPADQEQPDDNIRESKEIVHSVNLKFEKGNAVLNNSHIQSMETMLIQLFHSPLKRIDLIALTNEADRSLGLDRLKACEQYMVLRGVESSSINTQLKINQAEDFQNIVKMQIK